MFTREDTKLIKGAAVLLMLMHHLWGFPERIAGGELRTLFSVFGKSFILYVGVFGKICVSLFFFVSGYGMYKSSQNGEFNLLNKLKGLYLSYWKIFVIFIPLGFLFFRNQPLYCDSPDICNRFSEFSWDELVKNFLGMGVTSKYDMYNREWWFLQSYIYAILSFPLMKRIFDRYSAIINIAFIVTGSILVSNLFPAIGNIEAIGTLNNNFLYRAFFCQAAPYIACFWMGGGTAKDDLLIKLQVIMKKNNMLNPLSDIVIILLIVYLRNSGIGESADIFYVPILITAILDFVKRVNMMEKILFKIGNQSTNMWLIHTFFCYYFYGIVKIIVAPRWGILSLGLLALLTYMVSIVVTYFWDAEKKMAHHMKEKISVKFW